MATARLFTAALLALLGAGCGTSDNAAAPPGDAGHAAQAVGVTTPQRRPIAQALTVSGPVAAVEEMQLGVEVAGLRVTALNVDVGQRVRKGQVLLELDHRALDADLAQADAALREGQAAATLASANLARGENLAADKYISAMQLDELRAARTQAQARVGTLRAGRDAAALRRSFATLQAPARGVISKRLVQPGQVVGAGMELLRLIRDGRLEWRAELPEAQLARVRPGDTILLATRDGTAVQGRVRAVSPGIDLETRTGTVYADLPEPAGLQPGTYLEGRIDVGSTDMLVVPSSAVVLRDGFPTVFTVEGGTARARRVDTIDAGKDLLGVRSGLTAAQPVVTSGAGFLADGDAVRVVPASAPGAARP